ncbi:DUF1292 domain-containing protein [Hutsoniella sourekii]|uniref:DUF1292 domain-containing protein n=1 Tax=Hutsoniella sourekii TaxID=87650 RepID=UPI0004804838|nr:DUF1292 domain-containing protein [Hutsoniella sourekii]
MSDHHNHEHDHNHDHEDKQYLTLVDENNNETLYEVLFTFHSNDYDRNYVLLYPAGTADEENVELQAYAYVESEDGESGDLEPIESDEEWDMVEEVLNTFIEDEDNGVF